MAQGQPCNAIHPLHPDRDNSDGEFVRKAIAGEPLATDMLYRRHAHRLVMLATHLLANRADAEDAVQDAFIEAFRDLEKLREHAAFAPWITRITVHQVHRRYRRRRLRRIVGMLSPGSAEHGLLASARPELSPELHAELALIDAALRVVPPKHKVPWILRYVEGYTLVEVADACACSLASAKRHVQRANAVVAIHVDVKESSNG